MLSDGAVSVMVDGKMVAEKIKTSVKADPKKDKIVLECGVPEETYSQRNLADDVYDGVYRDLSLMAVDKEKSGELYERFSQGKLKRSDKALIPIYDNTLHGFELFKEKWDRFWSVIIDWFIANL